MCLNVFRFLEYFQAYAICVLISEAELAAIKRFLSVNPEAGDIMEGTGGARKIRFAGRGKGKSGGYRVITYFGGKDIPVFLLTTLSEGERDNLSKAERNELKKELDGLARDYRASVRVKVVQMSEWRKK